MDTFTTPPQHQTRSPSKETSSTPGTGFNKQDYILGIGLLLIVVFLWTSSNFVTQDLFEGGYAKPFLVTYLNTSAFALYLLPFLLRRWMGYFRGSGPGEEARRGRQGEQYQPLVTEPDVEGLPTEALHPTTFVSHEPHTLTDTELPPLTVQETAKLAFIFCFFWFVANWSVNASLDYTSVASATILSSMSGFFTLGIGRLFRVETLTLAKIGAVITSFGGVLLVSLSDSSQAQPEAADPTRSLPLLDALTRHAPRPLLGDSLALLSAIFYALYVILLKVRIRSESRIDMQLFFGFVGLFNVLSCWPIGVVLHLTGVETFELPTTGKAVGAILINMAITLSSDYLYVLAMLKTTPLVVTVGLSLTIPLAVLGDFFLSKPTRGQVILGAVLVLASFVVVGLENPGAREGPDLLEDDLVDDGRGTQAQLRLREEVELGVADER